VVRPTGGGTAARRESGQAVFLSHGEPTLFVAQLPAGGMRRNADRHHILVKGPAHGNGAITGDQKTIPDA
jgi:hypothetical protein